MPTPEEREAHTLQTLSVLCLAYAKSKDGHCQEMQGITIDGHVVVAGNSLRETAPIQEVFGSKVSKTRASGGCRLKGMAHESEATLLRMENGDLASQLEDVRELSVELAQRARLTLGQPRLDVVPHLVAPLRTVLKGHDEPGIYLRSNGAVSGAKGWFTPNEPGTLSFLDGDGTYHAEQHLLRVLAYRLAAGLAPDDHVTVWGVKPPCSQCRAVLDAFSNAYNQVYGQELVYNTARGRNTDVAQVDIQNELNAVESTAQFKRFLAKL